MCQPYIGSATVLSDYYCIDNKDTQKFPGFWGVAEMDLAISWTKKH